MVSLFLSGDVMIGRSFNGLFDRYPFYNIWGNTLSLLQNADFYGINLETTITDNNKKFPDKVFNFKLTPKYKEILKKSNVTYANLANNHSLDYGSKGLFDTISSLNNLNIAHSGAGENITSAQKEAVLNVKGLRIGILSSSDHPNEFKATRKTPGVNIINIGADNQRELNAVKKLRPKVDILIYSIHHGSNYVEQIPTKTIDFFHQLIDAGVDIIHGHSAHHVLPVEKYKNGYIFYSMGDYIDDYAVTEKFRNDLSFLAEIKIVNKKIVDIVKYPTRITNEHDGFILIPQVNFVDSSENDYSFVMNKLAASPYSEIF